MREERKFVYLKEGKQMKVPNLANQKDARLRKFLFTKQKIGGRNSEWMNYALSLKNGNLIRSS